MSPTAKVSGEAASAGMDFLTAKASPACYNRRARFRRPRSQAGTKRGDAMTFRSYGILACGAAALAALVVPVRAGGDKVAFPDNHEAAGVLFTTVDRADNKQFREFYTSAAALEAAKKGEPLPSGTVITMRQYAAKLDAQGN